MRTGSIAAASPDQNPGPKPGTKYASPGVTHRDRRSGSGSTPRSKWESACRKNEIRPATSAGWKTTGSVLAAKSRRATASWSLVALSRNSTVICGAVASARVFARWRNVARSGRRGNVRKRFRCGITQTSWHKTGRLSCVDRTRFAGQKGGAFACGRLRREVKSRRKKESRRRPLQRPPIHCSCQPAGHWNNTSSLRGEQLGVSDFFAWPLRCVEFSDNLCCARGFPSVFGGWSRVALKHEGRRMRKYPIFRMQNSLASLRSFTRPTPIFSGAR